MNHPSLIVVGIMDDCRQFNAELDVRIAASANEDSSRASEIKKLAALKLELSLKLPAMEIAAVESEDHATIFQTNKSRHEAVLKRLLILESQASQRVTMDGSGQIIRRIVAHYLPVLPGVLSEFYAFVEPVTTNVAALVRLSTAMQCLGAVRDGWNSFPKGASVNNRRHFDAICHRAAEGNVHLQFGSPSSPILQPQSTPESPV